MTEKIAKYLCILLASVLLLASCGTEKGADVTGTAPAGTETAEAPIALYEYEEREDGIVITSTRLLAKDLEVPSEIDGFPVVAIAPSVFCGIKETESVVIPEGVVSIGASAFEGCENLKEVTIPSSVTEIGERAFRSTPWYKSLTDEFCIFGDGVLIKYCGDDAEVVIPDSVKYLSDAFSGSEVVASVTIPESVKHIGCYAFSGSRVLSTVTFETSEVDIGNSAFTFCQALKEITFPESVKSLGEFTFSRCPVLERVVINAQIETLPLGFFMACAELKEVVLPDTLKTIDLSAFEGCKALEKVNLPASVESISRGAFDEGTPVTATVVSGSYAETYCEQNGIKYTAEFS